MLEKLVENWLTNVNELGYQIPFCELLLSEGYRVLHVSSHGPGEHGKDIIARDSGGDLWTFQLKGGDIRLSTWRSIRGEVEELVRLPVSYPGISSGEPHTPVLVTNGHILGDARENINRFAIQWETSGSRLLQVCEQRELLARFVAAHGKFLPAKLVDIRKFVEFYVGDFSDRLSREKFSAFLASLVSVEFMAGRTTHAKRAIESMVLLAGYVIQQYESAGNHISAAEGWTIVAATVLHVAQREQLPENQFADSLSLVRSALTRNLTRLEQEVLEREDFFEQKFILAESLVYGARVSLVLSWMAAFFLVRWKDFAGSETKKRLLEAIKREFKHIKLLGEVDWPGMVAIALFLEKSGAWRDADNLLRLWVDIVVSANRGSGARGFPSPYWLHEKVLSEIVNTLPPAEVESFVGKSYSIMSAMDMLVRRLCRQGVARRWSASSRIHACDFTPDNEEDWFLWSSELGELKEVEHQFEISWRKWREDTSELSRAKIPRLLVKYSDWLLPFSLTFPHRANRAICAFIDSSVGGRGKLKS